ncbi:hypothetical protein DAPPUDRAFT_238837 [Daphnia pulex]|uniref:Uncharacterized protein n=1 Tax=Daphnia pulex TaxID=6669 RepID=E9G7J4_DAPPU|nr:hypothetical protein DAPPUDRAFT_238837 [Daphnia pulex]|eukprot:EFX84633.1 hypothetical protein DAPPUDRAFT_238837 [Daphnia pulex]
MVQSSVQYYPDLGMGDMGEKPELSNMGPVSPISMVGELWLESAISNEASFRTRGGAYWKNNN